MSETDALPVRSRLVQAALEQSGLSAQVRELPDSARTAAEAAAALDCEVGAIASSLVFMATDADGVGRPLLVMTSGRHRVATARLAEDLGRQSIQRATAEEVRAATGQAIGGVAPVGHPTRVETIIDVALADYPQLWAAGGTPHTIFPLSYQDLLMITDGREATVGD